MPWKEQSAVDERMAFMNACERREVSFSALCRHFGVSRSTGYKWLQRCAAQGDAGLQELSRALHQLDEGQYYHWRHRRGSAGWAPCWRGSICARQNGETAMCRRFNRAFDTLEGTHTD